MTRTRTRRAMVRTVAQRMLWRSAPPHPSVRRWSVASITVLALASCAALLGVAHPIVVLLVGLASLVVLATWCLRLLTPALAVSVAGVALGCASVVTAMAVATGFERAIAREITRLNGHVLVTKYGLDFFEYDDLADRLLEDERVTAASPFAYSMVAVVPDTGELAEHGDDDRGPAIVIGKAMDPVRASMLHGIGDVLGRGELSGLRPGDVRHPPGLVLGDRVASRIGVEIGDAVRVVVPAEIDGSLEALGREPRHASFELLDLVHTGTAEIDDNLALMHLTAGQALFFREARVTGIELEIVDPAAAGTMAAQLDDRLDRVYRTSTWQDANEPTLVGLRQIKLALALVLGLMVLVAAASLVASMLLLIRRKRAAIATLMALGSDGRLVFWVFEAVGVLAGAAGAALGLALAGLYVAVIHRYHYPLAGDVYPLDHLPVVLSPVETLAPAVVAIALCAMASGPVALIATRVTIVRGLQP